jgi:predicted ATPase
MSKLTMRVAFSGTHATGKTTLIEALAERLPGYLVQEEPYYVLLDEGHDFGEIPGIEDFETQLEKSVQSLNESELGADVLFDRCPADFLAYALTHEGREAFDFARWLPVARQSMSTLDMVVFVPVERPDRIAAADEDDRLRAKVDRMLRKVLLDDSLDLGMEVIEVEGTLQQRVQAVLSHISSRSC